MNDFIRIYEVDEDIIARQIPSCGVEPQFGMTSAVKVLFALGVGETFV